jgi:hypothetical protein
LILILFFLPRGLVAPAWARLRELARFRRKKQPEAKVA